MMVEAEKLNRLGNLLLNSKPHWTIKQRAAARKLLSTLQTQIEDPTGSPCAFARYTLHFTPDPWQERVLRSTHSRLLLNCCRQSGKSITTSILALHQAIYTARSLVLLLSPTLRQSQELFKKVTDFLSLIAVKPEMTEENKLSLQLANGSRIVSLPSKEANIRGFSGASLIIEDEASRVPDSSYLAIRPMLAVSGGKLILMSTPWGKRGHFFEAWENGADTWERFKITAYECPRIPRAFIAQEQEDMPENWFRSEYLCEFTDAVDQVFSHEHVMAALSEEIEPLFAVDPVLTNGALDSQITPLGDVLR